MALFSSSSFLYICLLISCYQSKRVRYVIQVNDKEEKGKYVYAFMYVRIYLSVCLSVCLKKKLLACMYVVQKFVVQENIQTKRVPVRRSNANDKKQNK